jgi:deoxycytidine triphosphate deaminase
MNLSVDSPCRPIINADVSQGNTVDKAQHRFHQPFDLPIRLAHNGVALFCTQQVVNIPNDAIGHICLRSSYARMGLLTPPTVADPGFKGQLTLEIYNAGPPLVIDLGDELWQLVLVPAYPGTPVYKGKYQGSEGITLPILKEGGKL